MATSQWVITVVDTNLNWRKATVARLVTDAGLPPRLAVRWGEIRRGMSPAGLRRKIRETRN